MGGKRNIRWSVKVGSLVQKRWGRLDPHHQETVAVCLGVPDYGSFPEFIRVAYPGRKVEVHRAAEFEVVSEGR